MAKYILILLTLVFSLFTCPTAKAKLDGAHLNDVTDRLTSPHLNWAKPNAQKIKVLFIVSRYIAAREVVELKQRMAMDATTFVCVNNVALAVDDVYEGSTEGTSTGEKTREIIIKSAQHYDVVVMGNVSFDILPSQAKYNILKQIKEGSGLVLFYENGISYPQIFAKPTSSAREIVDIVSWDGLPVSLREKKIEETVKTFTLGKGRVVLVDYPGRHQTAWGGLSLTQSEPYGAFWKAHYENNMVLVAKTLLWSANKTPRINIENASFTNGTILQQNEWADKNINLSITNPDEKAVDLTIRLRDEWNQVCSQQTLPIKDNNQTQSFKLPFLAGGSYYLDVIAQSSQGVENFGYFSFSVIRAVGKMALITDKPSYEHGEIVKAKLILENPLPEAKNLCITLTDSPFGKIRLKQTLTFPANQKEMAFELSVHEFPTLAGALRVQITENNNVLGQQETMLFFRRQAQPIFPSFTWECVSDYMPEVISSQIRNAGFDSVLSWPTPGGENVKLNAILNFQFVPSPCNIVIKPDEKGWAASEIDGQKFADGSIYNPEVQSALRKSIQKKIENVPPYNPLVYNLGDENYFSYDCGYSPSEEKAFRVFLKEKYRTIENLNKEWNTSFASFETTKHFSQKELRENKNYPAWNDHRNFMEKQYADHHHFLARCIKEVDPLARVGAEGSIPGNLEATIDGLEFWGPYTDVVTNELLRSIGPDKLRTNWWGGYSRDRENPMNSFYGPLVRGAINGNSWFCVGPWSEGFLSVDLSYAAYFEKLLPAMKKLLFGAAPLLGATPMKQGDIAILWSHASASASVMSGQFINPTDGTEVLIKFCEQHGYSFDLLTSSMVEKGFLENYKILFLFGTSALSNHEKEKIENFAQNGGIVVADLNPGVLNEYCRPLGKTILANLFGTPELKGLTKFLITPVKIEYSLKGKQISFSADKIMTSPETATFKVNSYGKGIGILLNFGLGTACDTASPQTFDKFLSCLLDIAEVKPNVKVGGITPKDLIIRTRKANNFEVLSFLVKQSDIGKTLQISLPEKMFVYRIDGGLIGLTDHWEEKVSEQLMNFGIFKEKQSTPCMKLSQSTVRQGESVSLNFELPGENRIVRMELFDPQGKLMDTYPKLERIKTRQQDMSISFAFNDNIGQYRFRITDIATGLNNETDLQLIPEKE